MFKLQTSSAGPEEEATPINYKKKLPKNIQTVNGSAASPKSFNASEIKSHSTI